ncbi:MAG TPA: aromatic amino acid lyase, partial [Polyangia bacterium]|nr:aromatic amino acid lyase [Polyangia bacterium]
MTERVVRIDGNSLTVELVHAVAREGARVALTDEARARVQECREVIDEMVISGEAIYGVTTGIGEFARIRVSPEMGAELQRRIIYSHSAGTGDTQPPEVVRAAML